MGNAGRSVRAVPGFRELVHTKDGERDHEDNQNEAKGHETAEGEPPVERPQIGLAVHEHANDYGGGQGPRCGHHRHLRLYRRRAEFGCELRLRRLRRPRLD